MGNSLLRRKDGRGVSAVSVKKIAVPGVAGVPAIRSVFEFTNREVI